MKKKSLLVLVCVLMGVMSALAAEGYAVFNLSNKTLTFYYGNKPEGAYSLNEGSAIPLWYEAGNSSVITHVVFDPSFAQARPTSTAYWFYYMEKLTTITGLEYLNTSNVTKMHSMFFLCESLTTLDLSTFNTSNVTDMCQMFYGCHNLSTLNLSNFNTSNVTGTGMISMFADCYKLTSLDLSHFDTSKVTKMTQMFGNCRELTSLNVSNFNTSNVIGMYGMFRECEKLTSIDLSSFNTSKVTETDYMFYRCKILTSLDLGSFNTQKVEGMSHMFEKCYILKTVKVGSGWSTAAVTSSDNMFSECTSIVGGAGTTFDYNHLDAAYAHIDGGPSNPGYFTEKPVEQYDLWINGAQVTSANCNNLSAWDGASGTVYYTPSTKTLTLENARLTCGAAPNGACIRSNIDGLTISLKGTNVILVTPQGTNVSGMVLANTTITGGDTLGIQARRAGITIQGGKTLTINNVPFLNAKGPTYGIYSSNPTNTRLIVKGSRTKVDARGSSGAITGMNDLELNDGLKITEPAGGYFNNSAVYDASGNLATSVIISGNLRGDVNGDGKVNVTDVTALINMILGVIPKDEACADINGDSKVNVSDVTALVNIILGVS